MATKIRHVEAQSGALGSSITPMLEGLEGATQSYKMGAILINSSGKLVTGAADPTAATIAGLAVANATGTTDTRTPYVPLFPWGVPVVICLDDDSSTNAALTRATAQTDIGTDVALKIDAATGNWYLDPGDTSGATFRILAFVDPVGTIAGRVLAVRSA